MATRMVTDCDRCKKEGISDSYRLEIEVEGEKKRVDLDTKCLGAELQTLLSNLSAEGQKEWYEKIRGGKAAKKAGAEA